MSIYQEPLLLRSKDVDMFRRLRLSRLFELFQEASIRHTEQLGMGREKTLDKGVLWVLLMQRAELRRMPEYDEEILIRSWPGRNMHLLFPRYYAVDASDGSPLIRASAIWGLVDAGSRKLAFPERYGIVIDGVETGEEISLPRTLPKTGEAETDCLQRDFTVPYSFVDLNGHMNNTRYFDLAEDCVGAAAEGRVLSSIQTEYSNEARFGETLHLRWQWKDGTASVSGEGEKPVFRMLMTYQDQE